MAERKDSHPIESSGDSTTLQSEIDSNNALPKDILFMGTVGRITAYDISQSFNSSTIDHTLPIKWTTQAYVVSRSGKFHNTAFCLHYNRPTLFSAFNGTVTAMSADKGEVIWQVRPPSASGITSDDLGTITLSPLCPGLVFYGCNGYGICLEQDSGKILWETSLKKTGWNDVAILIFSAEMVIMGSQGYCYALDPKSGKVLWENKLEGTGYGDLTFAKYTINTHGSFTEDILLAGSSGYIISINSKTGETKHKLNLKKTGYNSVSLLVDQQNHMVYASTTGKAYESLRIIWNNDMPGMGTSCGQSIVEIGDNIYIGTFGKVTCINKKNGTSVWTFSLPSCGYEIVTLQVFGTKLFAGSNGKLYELNTASGQVIWRDNLKGYSYSQIYLGGYATYGYTDHNSTTIVQYIAEKRNNKYSYE